MKRQELDSKRKKEKQLSINLMDVLKHEIKLLEDDP